MFHSKKAFALNLSIWIVLLFACIILFLRNSEYFVNDPNDNVAIVLVDELFLLVFVAIGMFITRIQLKYSINVFQKEIKKFTDELDYAHLEKIFKQLVFLNRRTRISVLCLQIQLCLCFGEVDKAHAMLLDLEKISNQKSLAYCDYCHAWVMYGIQTEDYLIAYNWLEKMDAFFKNVMQEGKQDKVQVWFETYQFDLRLYDMLTANQTDSLPTDAKALDVLFQKENLSELERIFLLWFQYYLGKAFAFGKRVEEAKSCFENVAKGPEKLYVVQCARKGLIKEN